MGFFLGLIGYLTAVTLMIGGAVGSALWVTRPLPPPSEKAVTVTASAKRMQGADVALTKSAKKKVKNKRHASKQR